MADIRRQADGSGLLVLAHSKTDQEGRGSTLYLGPPTMQRIAAYLQAAGVAGGALFRRMRRGGTITPFPLSPTSIRSIVRGRGAGAGLQGRHSAHRLRVGSTQSLIERGATLPEAQLAGRGAVARLCPSLPFHSRKPGRIGKYESFGHYNGPQGEFRSCSEGRLVHGKRHRIDAKCFVDFPLVSIWIGGRADMERVAAPGFEDAGRAHLAPKDPPERRPA